MGRERRQELVGRAQRHLEALIGDNQYSQRAAVLREQAAFTLGNPVDWSGIDAAFEAIIGGDYAGTVGRYLDRRHHGVSSRPTGLRDQVRILRGKGAESPEQRELRELFASYGVDRNQPDEGGADKVAVQTLDEVTTGNVGDLLLVDFTSMELLKGVGRLYLARADALKVLRPLGDDSAVATAVQQAAGYAKKAYDCFDACRILQEAHGNESIVTKFLRGRAITSAADHRRSVNPFPWHGQMTGRTLLEEGERLLSSAMQGSVGGFNRVCRNRLKENRKLQQKLGVRPT